MFSDDDEPVTRARYLMSPYNLQEARKQRRARWIVATMLVAFAVVQSLVIWWLLHAR